MSCDLYVSIEGYGILYHGFPAFWLQLWMSCASDMGIVLLTGDASHLRVMGSLHADTLYAHH